MIVTLLKIIVGLRIPVNLTRVDWYDSIDIGMSKRRQQQRVCRYRMRRIQPPILAIYIFYNKESGVRPSLMEQL